MTTFQTKIRSLNTFAEKLLAIPVENGEEFVAGLADYLELFDQLQSDTSAKPVKLQPAEQQLAKKSVEKLQELHTRVLARSVDMKAEIAKQLGDVFHRSQALRAYVDPYPSRISITGKRQG